MELIKELHFLVASLRDVDTWLSRIAVSMCCAYMSLLAGESNLSVLGMFWVFCDSKRRVYFHDNLIQNERLYVIGLRKRRKLIYFSFQLIS